MYKEYVCIYREKIAAVLSIIYKYVCWNNICIICQIE